MMFSQALNSDTFFKELMEVAQDEPTVLPQATTIAYSTTEEPAQTKHPLLVEDDEDVVIHPPSKRVRTSGDKFLRIPCKARGMSNKHNFDTAYLDIPVDAPHGLLLSCSHPECAESGRKFRYCIVCASPVAKRNFPKRHGHGLIHSAKDLKEVDYTTSFVEISSIPDAGCYPCTTEQTSAVPKTFEKPRHRRVVSYDESTYAPVQQPPATAVQQPVATRPPATDSLLNLSAKEQQWLGLLHNRPNLEQESNMTNWMDKIICFSEEKGSALRKAPTVAPTAAGVEQPAAFFAPSLPPPQQRGTIETPPLLEPVTIEDDYYFPTRSISPFEANKNIFDETPAPVEPPVEPVAFVDQQFLQTLELEPPVVMDNVDLTTFFD